MARVIIFGGTIEGRKLTEWLVHTDVQVDVCVATEYGASLLPKGENIQVCSNRMGEEEMVRFLREKQADYCLDATHPYAVEVTKNLVAACEQAGLPYIRVLRQEIEEKNCLSSLQHGEGVRSGKTESHFVKQKSGEIEETAVFVESVEQAAEYLCHTTGNIFLTTGSKELEKYTVIPDYQNRCIARVLPTLPVMEKCKALGFEGKNLIGMQGPFSEAINYEMFKQTNAKWLVTKSSGKAGGYPEKCEAAIRLGIRILIVGRPVEHSVNCMSLEEVIFFIKKQYFLNDREVFSNEKKKAEEAGMLLGIPCNKLDERLYGLDKNYRKTTRRIDLVAMGPGNPKLLTQEAVSALENCDVLIGAKRVLEIWDGYDRKPYFMSYKKEEILSYLKEHSEYRKAAICYSGDIGFYSGAKGMREYLSQEAVKFRKTESRQETEKRQETENRQETEWEINSISGISSVTYFLNRLGIPWEDVKLVSCHGKQADILQLLQENQKVCTLLGEKDAVSNICRQLIEAGMSETRVTIGERLSYPEEQLIQGYPQAFIDKQYNTLTVLLIERASIAEGNTCCRFNREE